MSRSMCFSGKARTLRGNTWRFLCERGTKRRSLWIDSRLLERSGKIAERDGVPRNRVLYTRWYCLLKGLALATEREIGYLRKIKSQAGQQGRPIGSSKKPKKCPPLYERRASGGLVT